VTRGPFAKVYRSLWDGTLARTPEAWIVFVFLLVHCDADGVIEMTPEAIAARSGLKPAAVKRGLEALEQPDPDSRTSSEEGRRLMRLNGNRSWGWRIVNYSAYRNQTESERAAAYRQRRRVEADERHGASRGVTQHHQAEAEAEAEEEEAKHPLAPRASRPTPSTSPPRARACDDLEDQNFKDFYMAYPRRAARRIARLAFTRAVARYPEIGPEGVIAAARRYVLKVKNSDPKYIPYPAKWLDGDSFLDVLARSAHEAAKPAPPSRKQEELKPPTEEEQARVRELIAGVVAKVSMKRGIGGAGPAKPSQKPVSEGQ
jgi:hypothetical protein